MGGVILASMVDVVAHSRPSAVHLVKGCMPQAVGRMGFVGTSTEDLRTPSVRLVTVATVS